MSFADRYEIRPDPNTVRIVDSEGAGWSSIYAANFRHAGIAEPFETAATPYQKFSLISRNRLELASRTNGRWPMAIQRAGSIGLTPPGRTKHLRWRAVDGWFETAQLYVPPETFASAADEYRRIGAKHRSDPLQEAGFSDPVVARLIRSVIYAAASGAPELYAQSAAQFLAMHTMRMQSGWPAREDERRPGNLSDSRLGNVIAFMQTNYRRPLSLDELAREAGVSSHHFAHLFKRVTGDPPHRFLTKIRLEAAALMLQNTDASILDVALACGYYATSHFSDAFRRSFRKSPTQFRAETKRDDGIDDDE